jgi:hypothetical protein
MKKIGKKIIKLTLFIIIANLPFLTMSQLLGINTFLDTFKHPDSFLYIKGDKLGLSEKNPTYYVLQKQTNGNPSICEGDSILYRTTANTLHCNIVYDIKTQQGTATYYTTNANENTLDGPIFQSQILGKVTGTIDDNIWNALSLQVWDLSRANLNAVSLLSNN